MSQRFFHGHGIIKLGNKMERRRVMKLLRLLATIYFRNIEVKGTIPNNATFFVSNHRNGAVDGLVLYSVIKQKMISVIGNNLTKSPFMRMFFGGHIEIYRYPKNISEMRYNKKQLHRIPEEIERGTSVLMFPEGTSHLGKGLLEIRDGVAHVVSSLHEPTIVPIGLHYEKGWSFKSDVFVHIGEPVTLVGKNKTVKVEEIKTHMQRVYNDDYEFKQPKKNLLLAICLLPIILLFFLLNILTFVIPYVVAKKFADDVNVITLWRILSGVPTFLLQTIVYIVLSIWCPWLLLAYIVITIIGLRTYRAWKDATGIE